MTQFQFIICLDYVICISIDQIKKDVFTLKKKQKARSRPYPTETITDVDYADGLALLAYTSAQAESFCTPWSMQESLCELR